MGKFKTETAAQAYARLETLKKAAGKTPTPLQKHTIEATEKLAKSLMDTEMKAKNKAFDDKYAGEDWWELGKKLYPITQHGEKWVVKSTAKEWKGPKEWEYDYEFLAKEQVEKLMKYKDIDRDKGTGDRDKDLEKWSKKFESPTPIKLPLIQEMLKLLPGKSLNESDLDDKREKLAKLQADLKSVRGNCPGDDRNRTLIRSEIRELQDEIKKCKSIKESDDPDFHYTGYEVSHEPDGVMVLVMGDDGSDEDYDIDYYGVNVVFRKPGTKPELVAVDNRSEWQAKHDEAKIIAAAEKQLGKEEQEHLASL